VTEFALFLPITLYALWPQIRARLVQMRFPRLQVIDGASTAKVTPDEPANSDRRDPPLRSSG
jgi:hypothetical protein